MDVQNSEETVKTTFASKIVQLKRNSNIANPNQQIPKLDHQRSFDMLDRPLGSSKEHPGPSA